jgi:hypothetical protein
MTPLPLDQIGFGWRSHCSALWWLGLLYRRPRQVREALQRMPRWPAARAGLALYLNAIPYAFLVCVIGRCLLVGLLDVPLTDPPPDSSALFGWHLNPDFPDGSVVSAWRLRLFLGKPSVSIDCLLK